MHRAGQVGRGWLWVVAVAVLGVGGMPPVAEGAKWRTYENCRLVTDAAYDGDSFHVRHGRRTEIFRLYFVDAPETDLQFPDRVQEQADYWKVSVARAMEIGEAATAFAETFLQPGFVVETLREDARGNSSKPRFFAFVRSAEGQDLGLALVEAGLARIYGVARDLPDGTTAAKYRARLRAAERRAQREQRGGWQPQKAEKAPARTTRTATKPAPVFTPHELVLTRPLPLYSLQGSGGQVGVLPTGTTVRVLQPEGTTHVRVRFLRDGGAFEAKCRRADLGL